MYSLGIVMYRFLNQNRTPFLPDAPNPIAPRDREEAQRRRMIVTTPGTISEDFKEKSNTVLSAGAGHSLAIDKHGNLITWGLNKHGQLGCGSPIIAKRMNHDVLSDVVSVLAGAFHSMVITSDNVSFSAKPD